MENSLSGCVMGIPMTSTRRLLLSKPYKPQCPLSTSEIKGIERKDNFSVRIKNHMSLVPKLMEIMKQKLSSSAKILPLGHEAKIFMKNFSSGDSEKLLHTYRCRLYTTAGAITGILFMTTERVAFCSERSLQTYSTTGELLKFQYKVSIPLEKIKGVGESMSTKRPLNKNHQLTRKVSVYSQKQQHHEGKVVPHKRFNYQPPIPAYTTQQLQHLASISYHQGNQIPTIRRQNMENSFSGCVMGIPMTSTRGLLLSKPYEPHFSLSTSKIKGIERKDSFSVRIKNHVSLVPKLMKTMKQTLSYGAKILPLGHEAKLFRKSFGTRDSEKLLHVHRCHIYTTAGAIAGILFMTTERVGFCSERSLQTYSTTGELLKFQYKVSIPLDKIKGVGESMNMKRPSNKYVELVTMDAPSAFNFNSIPSRQPNHSRNMDSRLSGGVMGIPMTSTRRLLLSKPYELDYPLSTSKTNVAKRKGGFAVSIKNHVSLVPKLTDSLIQKLSHGAKILPLGREAKIIRKSFNTKDSEKLLHATRCCIYTTAGAIAGVLFMTTERVGFYSDRSLKTYSTTGELLKFQYKVSIPLEKIKGVGKSLNIQRPSNNCIPYLYGCK
ncbi:hypothetical protein OSB04_022007 [Centaurea solstitialis]|uniref:GRAM domain-containing protein n=1 Tax=Centaurea solstitialis TaxID=347529 RepID=A0AA38SV96_9ASTR|nr:hypothetical protein OSB04_022007 [Centaurea solstitialis]